MIDLRSVSAAAVLATALAGAQAASAAEAKLPKNLAWTAYGTTSSGYAQSVGLGNMLKKRYGTELRVIPGKNDVSRMLPLKAGQAEICACGIAAYFAQEGVLLFANKNWGPSPLLNLFNNIGRNGIGLAIANDIGAKTAADLKGKRVAWVKGAPALNVNAQAVLAFGGLTWDDVEKVEVPGWGQSMQAIIDGQLDAAAGSPISGVYPQIATSPRGLYHHDLPHSDEAGWRRLQAVAPYWSKLAISAAVNGENNPTGKMPYEGGGYPYPTFISMPDATDDLAYGLVKAVMENYEDFKDAGPGMDGYQLANQNLAWVFPYHPGAIVYFKEAGEWGAEEQSHNDGLLKRQDVLMKAWEAFRAKGDVADAAFEEAWLKARAEALEAAGMPAPFSEPL